MHALARNLPRVMNGFTRKVYACSLMFVSMVRVCQEIETGPVGHTCSGMIGIYAKVGEKKLLPARAVTAAIRLDGNEYRIDFIQGFWIVEL